ncbi:alpha-2-macroglobulin-like isoform X2 [Ahaetulla prasina]|uniref:alpha-2-macroglobulin-like isoform X1 n=1 Tax=Ahaetulla prasina TaxID=499056 RepID=UPI002648DB1F|nr:alpha-2-macroglobulin-like isoform X1 [Ahaetulla prasina]XP_058026767.1 alpha-2-macroglobulin-like isoform X2 [Ahaetulla prasina]
MGKNWILAGPCLFLLGLFLLPGGTSASTPKPQYLVLVPVVVHTETSRQICVQLNHLNESVTLSITLEYGLQNRSLLREEVSKKELFKCTQFQLPKWESSFNSHIALFTVEVTGATLRYLNRKRVYIENRETLFFVHTDKPIYKPGQKILFRVVSLNEKFLPVNEKVPMIYIEDSKGNRLFQWKDVELNGGLAQFEFPLASEPALGTYKVVVQKDSERRIQHTCTVDEYVLPKFEVVVKTAPVITILDQELKATICAKYTYGKPVPGLVSMRVCRRYSHFRSSCYGEESKAICEEFSGQADIHGCFSHLVDLKIFQLKRNGFQMEIRTEGIVTEEGTEVVLTGSGITQITSTISSISFENVDSYYKPGLPFSGEIKLVDGKSTPLANKTIELQISEVQNSSYYKTDGAGRVHFSIETSGFTNDAIQLTATYEKVTHCYDSNWISPQHHTGYFTAPRFYSPSESYLKIQELPGTLKCGQHAVVPVHYVLNSEVIKDKEVVFHYLVVARGDIVKTGTYPLKEKHNKGIFNLDLLVDMKTAPLARLLVYTILDNGELVVHTAKFPVEPCFANKVNLRFAEREGLPGSNINLHLAAAQNSLCAIHAVDESVFVLKPETELSARTVYDLLPLKDLSGYYYKSENLEDPDTNPCVPPTKIIVGGIRYQTDTYSYGEGDAYTILRDFGFKPFTSAQIYKPNICSRPDLDHYPRVYSSMESGLAGPPGPELFKRDGAEAVDTTFRTFFPETWIWSLKPLGSETELTLPVTIPDTITEWRAGAFCLSPAVGFGLAKTTFVKAFQPFFVDLTMPYNVIRGEAFVLKATVYNYLRRPIQISISLLLSPDYDATPVEKEQSSYCLPVDGRKTVSWNVTPKTLGEVNFTITAEALKSTQLCGNEIPEVPAKGQRDIVVKSLLVEPEGIENEVVINNLLCGAKDSQSTAISLKVPENIVEKSARAFCCVLGDILSSAIQNVQQLLRLPSGCGEQNMALLAPNIYILDYLNKTDQLTEETRSKGIAYLVTGYQRQLNYKHADGSYSTFGERNNQPGNVWLTAFVLKGFSQAKRYISVEERHLIDAQTFLALKQKSNGCFHSTGSLLNNALKGGVDDEVTTSAYITISMLEMPLPVTHSVVRNALFCMETASQQKDLPLYTEVLLGYVFALAHKEDKVTAILQSLQKKAVKGDDGSIHWERPVKPEAKQPVYYQPRAPSAEVELNAYMLLTYLNRVPAGPTKDDLAMAAKIVSWLIKQQNPSGGFASTQDTVLALQALSFYAALTFSKNTAGTKVALKSGGNNVKEFHVDNNNRLLLQCQTLPSVPGEYTAAVTGESCIYVQTTLRYNVLPHLEDDPFALIVSTIPETCVGVKAHKEFDISINVSYTGKRPASNMVIINVKMVSGFAPNKPSVKKLEKQPLIQRVDVTATNVVLYLEKLTNATEQISFTVERNFEIQNQRPAFVEVYDYYEGASAVVSYSTPCSTAHVGNA